MSRSGTSDADLIAGCRRGDQRAWEALVDRYERYVFAIGRGEGLDRYEAEDLTQTVFLGLVTGLDAVADPDRLAAWLGTSARRHAWRRRDKLRRVDVVDFDDDDDPTLRSEPDADEVSDLLTLMEAVDGLGKRCRELLTRLYFSEDASPSYDSVSADLGIPRGSIGPTRARCLAKLRAVLEHDPHYDSATD